VQNTGNGQVISVDISPTPQRLYRKLTKRTLWVVKDASEFIQSYTGTKFDFIYFDSMSISFESPQESMFHHLKLYEESKSLLNRGGYLVFDDTPKSLECALSEHDRKLLWKFRENNGFIPGKGALVLLEVDQENLETVFHDYALILRDRLTS
jgi:spermidine synthase